MTVDYGVSGSFTAGTGAKVFDGPVPFGISVLCDLICPGYIPDHTLNFAFDELNLWSYTQPTLVMRALETLLSQGNNSTLLYKTANFAAELARRFPNEIIKLYKGLRSNSKIAEFNRGYFNSILLNMGKSTSELVFPLIVESISQETDTKNFSRSMIAAIEWIGLFGHVNPPIAFEKVQIPGEFP
ncbi:MAG: hypothetical protein ACHQUC_04840 [Chlamydiales bacterium]